MPALIESQVNNIRDTDAGAHTFDLDLGRSLLVYGRADELESIVGNLLANAIQYTEAGGRISICWQREEQDGCLTVSDTGIGIEAADLPRLTERFYRVD